MNQYNLAQNILMLLEKNNKNIKELATALDVQPKYLKQKLHKMIKSKDESFIMEPVNRTLGKECKFTGFFCIIK